MNSWSWSMVICLYCARDRSISCVSQSCPYCVTLFILQLYLIACYFMFSLISCSLLVHGILIRGRWQLMLFSFELSGMYSLEKTFSYFFSLIDDTNVTARRRCIVECLYILTSTPNSRVLINYSAHFEPAILILIIFSTYCRKTNK